MAHQTIIFEMFQQIGKVKHEEALQHEPLVGRPNLQPHMTLQSLGKCINQESEEGTGNQESKKRRRGTYTQWFAPNLWPRIQIIMERHRSLTIVFHNLHAFHRKSKEHSSPLDKLSRSSLREWFTSVRKLKLGVEKSIERGRAFIIMEQHIPILDCRPEVRDKLMSLVQKIRTFGQALSGPIVQPIIQSFL
jgi:hypothetical protein